MKKRWAWLWALAVVGSLAVGAWAFEPVAPEDLKPGFM